MSPSSPVDGLARAFDATGNIIAAVQDDQWSNPTPCEQWNVRALVNHLVVGNNIIVALLRDDPPHRLEELRKTRDSDHLGENPLGTYRQAGEELLHAFRQPLVLDRVFQAAVGAAPGAVLLHLRITELLVHGWDLARATGQPADLPDDLAEQELAFASGPQAPRVPRTGHPFGPIQTARDEAPAIERLVAYLGRSVVADSQADDHA